ncbi:MAG: GGDEF domain-containing protein [Phycisphaerales bacterium]|nr:GGDEF domain-containing protein [Phycisphaerales bacterium]
MQEASLRVILAGRTGLDATLRRDPAIELLRVKTPVELVGELSQPIDDQSPADAVVIIGPEVESMVDAADMVGSLRMICPRVRVIVSTATAPSQHGFDGVIRPEASAESLRELLRRLPAVAGTNGRNGANEGPAYRQATPGLMLDTEGGAVPQGFIVGSAIPPQVRAPHASTPARAQAAPEQPAATRPVVVVTPAARQPIVPRPIGSAVRMNEVGAGGEGPAGRPTEAPADLLGDPIALDLQGMALDSVEGPIDVPLRSTIDDRDVLVQVTAGRNPLPAAVALLRHRMAAPDVSFLASAGAATHTPAGAPVRVGDEVVGHLTSSTARPDQLADGASWLGGWLVLRQAHAQACRSALTDALTGAYNRRFFDRFLPAAMEQAGRKRHDLSVLMLDVDNFKTFNDRYGHAAGDQILTETVRLLRSLVRNEDRVCRIGGDEFAVVFFEPHGPRAPGSKHPTTAQGAAARFQAAIESHRFPRLGPEAVGRLTISGGLATFPWDGLTPERVLAVADGALLEAKRHGKNSIVIG